MERATPKLRSARPGRSLLARAGEIGHGAARIAMGEEKASSQEVAMIRDVLDRILGHSTARVEVATFDGFEEDFAALIAEMNRQP